MVVPDGDSRALREACELSQAETACRNALSIDWAVADLHLQLGHVLRLQGRRYEATAEYLRAFALDPSFSAAIHELRGLGCPESELLELRRQMPASVAVDGFCPICDAPAHFHAESPWLRDHFLCAGCGSIPRERALMATLEMFYPQWPSLAIHESSPAQRAVSLRLSRMCPDYTTSFFDPSVPLGQLHPERGYRCENLEGLTFPNASFDLVLTQDVFEHVLRPDRAIQEIDRVLRPGGAYVMTVPIVMKNSGSSRRAGIDPSGNLVHHKEPQFHGNPIDDNGSLVTIDWGYDILDYLSFHSPLRCSMVYIDDLSRGIQAEFIEVVVCRKGVVPPL
jgi:SAM-dependent methyltransferase